MKNKMLQIKNYVGSHKKQIIIGASLAVVAIVGGKKLIKKLKAVEVSESFEEITGGVIEEIATSEVK